jgi:hypothetical protein
VSDRFEHRADIAALGVVGAIVTAIGAWQLIGVTMLAWPGHGQPPDGTHALLVVAYYAVPLLAFLSGMVGLMSLPRKRPFLWLMSASVLTAMAFWPVAEVVNGNW